MVRKTLLALVLIAAQIAHVNAQSPTPPPGFFTALADLSAQTHRNFSLTCSGSTCTMNDGSLAWSWNQSFYADDSLDCPGVTPNAVGRRSGMHYTFTYNGVEYDYREDLTTGIIIYCAETGGSIVQSAPVPNTAPSTAAPAADASSPPSATECPLPGRLQVGGTGRVVAGGFPSNVRSQPTIDGAFLGEMQPGGAFLVLEGPVCATTLLWYRVDHNGLIGWAAEGGGADYWLEPVSATAAGQTIVPVTVGNVTGLQQISSSELATSGAMSVYSGVSGQLIVAAGGQLDFYPVGHRIEGSEIVALTINNAGTRLVSLQNDGLVRFWEIGTGPTIADIGELPITSGRASWIKIDPTGTFLAVGIETQPGYRVEVYDLRISPLVPAPLAQSAPPVSMDFLSSGGTLAVMGSDAFITFYTTSDYQIAPQFVGLRLRLRAKHRRSVKNQPDTQRSTSGAAQFRFHPPERTLSRSGICCSTASCGHRRSPATDATWTPARMPAW